MLDHDNISSKRQVAQLISSKLRVKQDAIVSLAKGGLPYGIGTDPYNPAQTEKRFSFFLLTLNLACEYSRLSFAPAHVLLAKRDEYVVEGANERRLYSQATLSLPNNTFLCAVEPELWTYYE